MTASNDELIAMETFNIISESKTVYRYKEYRYDRLKDALKYAKQDVESSIKKADSLSKRNTSSLQI